MARRKSVKSAVRRARKKNPVLFTIFCIIVIILVAVAIYGYMNGWFDEIISKYFANVAPNQNDNPSNINSNTYNVQAIKNEQLSIHFLELGNEYTGDSVYIKAGDTDVLIDAGSRKGSAETIGDYIDQYCTDGKLEYVIATHAHQDHIAGFVGSSTAQGIFERYDCKNIIEFAKTEATSEIYKDYCTERNAEIANGANCYTALDCVQNKNGWSPECRDGTPAAFQRPRRWSVW